MRQVTSEQISKAADHLLMLGVVIALALGVAYHFFANDKPNQPMPHRPLESKTISQPVSVDGRDTTPGDRRSVASRQAKKHAYDTGNELYGLISLPVLSDDDLVRAHYLMDILFQSGVSGLQLVRELLQIPDAGMTREHRALRMTLINILWYLDDPVVKDIALGALQITSEPNEIYELASLVREWSQPGVHQWEILQVTNSALEQGIEEGNTESLGPLFQVLGEFGDGATLRQLQSAPKHLQQYAAVALAMLPDGRGVDTLLADARNGSNTLQGKLAMKLLAQMSLEHARAADALVQLMADNLVPAELWPEIKAMIEGSQRIQVTVQPGQRANRSTIFLPEGNQVIYEVKNLPLEDAFDRCSGLHGRLLSANRDNNARRLLTTLCDRL